MCVFGYFLFSYQAISCSVCVCVNVCMLLLLLFKETRRRRTKKGNIMHNLQVYIYNIIYNIHHIYKSFHFGNPKSDVKPE